MRLAFCTSPGYGHFLPVVPVAWAARSEGHEVLVVTTAAAARAAAAAGLPVVDVGPSRDREHVRLDALDRGTLPPAQHARPDRRMAARMVAAMEAWRPDLVVTEPNDFMAPVAAGLLSIPVVIHGLGVLPVPPTPPPPLPHVTFAFDRPRSELPAPNVAGTIDTCPPSLRGEAGSRAWRMRYVPYNGGCVRALIDSVRELDAEVILALGDVDLTPLEGLPANVRCTRWLPLTELLPTCDLIVHHGGSGTTMNAVVAGVPQCVLPFRDGAMIQRRGLGLALDAGTGLTASAIRHAIEVLLGEPRFREAANEVRREVAAMPPPVDVLRRMEDRVSPEASTPRRRRQERWIRL